MMHQCHFHLGLTFASHISFYQISDANMFEYSFVKNCDTNIFGYSFVSNLWCKNIWNHKDFWYKYTQIFVCIFTLMYIHPVCLMQKYLDIIFLNLIQIYLDICLFQNFITAMSMPFSSGPSLLHLISLPGLSHLIQNKCFQTDWIIEGIIFKGK